MELLLQFCEKQILRSNLSLTESVWLRWFLRLEPPIERGPPQEESKSHQKNRSWEIYSSRPGLEDGVATVLEGTFGSQSLQMRIPLDPNADPSESHGSSPRNQHFGAGSRRIPRGSRSAFDSPSNEFITFPPLLQMRILADPNADPSEIHGSSIRNHHFRVSP